MQRSEFAVRSEGEVAGLAMQHLQLEGTITPAGGRLRVDHHFCGGAVITEAVYCFLLGRDAALRRFKIAGNGFEVSSRLEPAAAAAQAYEAAIEAGSMAGLARQYPDGLVNLSLGNLRPGEPVRVGLEIVAGVELHNHGLRFRFPFCLAPGYHARAVASAVCMDASAAEILLPVDEFGDLLLPVWRETAAGVHSVGFRMRVALPQAIKSITSLSHAVRVERTGAREAEITLAVGADVPDRDLVLEVETEAPCRSALAGVDKAGRGRFLAVVAGSELTGSGRAQQEGMRPEPRRLVVAIDRSGSMEGEPMAQARAAAAAVLDGLAVGDEFGLVAFDNAPAAFRPALARLVDWRGTPLG